MMTKINIFLCFTMTVFMAIHWWHGNQVSAMFPTIAWSVALMGWVCIWGLQHDESQQRNDQYTKR